MANLEELKGILGNSSQQIKDGISGLTTGRQQAEDLLAGFNDMNLTGAAERTQPLITALETVLAALGQAESDVESAVGLVHNIQA